MIGGCRNKGSDVSEKNEWIKGLAAMVNSEMIMINRHYLGMIEIGRVDCESIAIEKVI